MTVLEYVIWCTRYLAHFVGLSLSRGLVACSWICPTVRCWVLRQRNCRCCCPLGFAKHREMLNYNIKCNVYQLVRFNLFIYTTDGNCVPMAFYWPRLSISLFGVFWSFAGIFFNNCFYCFAQHVHDCNISFKGRDFKECNTQHSRSFWNRN